MSIRGSIRRGVNTVLARLVPDCLRGRMLLYHHVAVGTDPTLYVDPVLFERHLEWIAVLGLRGVSAAEAFDTGFRDDVVAFTFDDGYVSVEAGCRALSDRNWSATIFVVPAWCDEGRPGVLSWSAIRDLTDAGFEVAAHGADHSILTAAGDAVDLRRARTTIEDRVGRSCRGLSYPHGVSTRAARAAAATLYDYACTTEPRRNSATTPRATLGRNEVMGTDTSAALIRGKLAGSDDWMAAVRAIEIRVRHGA